MTLGVMDKVSTTLNPRDLLKVLVLFDKYQYITENQIPGLVT
jgi:hypothetical protein